MLRVCELVCELVARVCVDDAVLTHNAKKEIESTVILYHGTVIYI